MPGRRKKESVKDYIVEHIADFADNNYEEEATDLVAIQKANKRDAETEDETDNLWMYKDNLSKKETQEETLREENQEDTYQEWEEEEEMPEEPQEAKKEEKAAKAIQQKRLTKVEHYMDAAVWFHEMTEEERPSETELRYVELMILELAEFYFGNLGQMHPSKKCRQALHKIGAAIQSEGLL